MWQPFVMVCSLSKISSHHWLSHYPLLLNCIGISQAWMDKLFSWAKKPKENIQMDGKSKIFWILNSKFFVSFLFLLRFMFSFNRCDSFANSTPYCKLPHYSTTDFIECCYQNILLIEQPYPTQQPYPAQQPYLAQQPYAMQQPYTPQHYTPQHYQGHEGFPPEHLGAGSGMPPPPPSYEESVYHPVAPQVWFEFNPSHFRS